MNWLAFLTKCRRFGSDIAGNVALLFALMAVPLTLAAGAGVDYSRAANIRATLQSAADSAALAGAHAYTGAIYANSAQTLASNYMTKGSSTLQSLATLGSPTVTPGTATTNGVVTGYTMTVAASATMPTTLMALIRSNVTVNVTAKASNAGAGATTCLLALHPTANGAISLSSSARFNGQNCAVAANSTSNSALTLSSSANVTARTIFLKGNKSLTGSSTLTLTDAENVNYAPGTADPYAGLYPQPTMPTSCTATNFQLDGSNTATIYPGRYCGGIRTNSSSVLTMSPGTYYIDAGNFTTTSSSRVICGGCTGGNGVTLVLTATNAANIGSLQFSSSSVVDLVPPGPASNQPYPGIVVYQDPRISTSGPASNISSSSQVILTGVIYLPNTALNISSSGIVAPASGRACTVMIVRTLVQSSSSYGATGDCASYGSLMPGGSRKVTLIL